MEASREVSGDVTCQGERRERERRGKGREGDEVEGEAVEEWEGGRLEASVHVWLTPAGQGCLVLASGQSP